MLKYCHEILPTLIQPSLLHLTQQSRWGSPIPPCQDTWKFFHCDKFQAEVKFDLYLFKVPSLSIQHPISLDHNLMYIYVIVSDHFVRQHFTIRRHLTQDLHHTFHKKFIHNFHYINRYLHSFIIEAFKSIHQKSKTERF